MKDIIKQDYLRRLYAQLNQSELSGLQKDKITEYAKRLLDEDMPVLFDSKHIAVAFNLERFSFDNLDFYYHCFPIGNQYKQRRITAPSIKLKSIQRWILKNILEKIPLTEYAYGFRKGYSILHNAKLHMNNQFALCMDIQDFFGSISIQKVNKVFRQIGYSSEASKTLGQLCCYQEILPQGAPTSPYLANIICKEMDLELAEFAYKHNAVYSRYADDITFSSNNKIDSLYSPICNIVQKYQFKINQKTKYYDDKQHKIITGLIVQNGCVRVPKHFKRTLQQEIYYCTKFGVDAHLDHTKSVKRIHFKEYLYGKAYYISMVEPEIGKEYLEKLDKIDWPAWM